MQEMTYRKWLWETTAERCVKNLVQHGFDAHFFPARDAAREAILKMVAHHQSFGFGGSETTRALGLVEALSARGKTLFDHWPAGLGPEEVVEIRKNQMRADCFFTSANAIAATGEVVNVDGCGNRTNAMCFGPAKVVIVAGMNKVRPTLEAALARVREVAGPMRAKSLNMPTPCTKTGTCHDCNTPQRICRITVILHRRPALTDVSVVLIGEELGF
jgi:L-lactate utilization protein LutB